ncbi:hypothetical protein [Microbacterium esteraromaticum]|uniref:hypothetical protein n=1 Tax=Microbacterium esteraromaticum TaxID=57043 RepID=UPI001C96C26A|nr:hypothetical protein [Microbacterium esteraromaticum]MBY6061607.1 hypothetical protein [Microbacterium esteraromaticum]
MMTSPAQGPSMSRDPGRLIQENRRYRRRAQDAESHAAQLASIVTEQGRMLLGVWMRGVLTDPADFLRYVDLDEVTGPSGEFIWTAVDEATDRLLAKRPYLAAPGDNPWQNGVRAVDWFTTEE